MQHKTDAQQEIADSHTTLSLYLETLFRKEVVDQEASIVEQGKPHLKTDLEVMLIEFNDYKLAIPVKDIHSIFRLEPDKLITMPEQAEYMLGVCHRHGKQIPVFDLAFAMNTGDKLCAPDKSFEKEPTTHQVLVLSDERMAFICQGSEKILHLKRDDIRWNKSRARNRWLQGLLVNEMACLLDIRHIKRLFRRDFAGFNDRQDIAAA